MLQYPRFSSTCVEVSWCGRKINMMNVEVGSKLSLAVEKGHNMRDDAVGLLQHAGFHFDIWKNGGLHALVTGDDILRSIALNHGVDIANRLNEGVVQFGIFGRDRLREAQLEGIKIEEVIPLGLSLCRVVLEVPIASDYYRPEDIKKRNGLERIRVATSYPCQAGQFFIQHNTDITIVKYEGGEEGAPDADAAEAVVAAYVRGTAAGENHLRLIDTLEASTLLKSEGVLGASSEFLREHGRDKIVEQFIDRMRQATRTYKNQSFSQIA